MRLRPYISSSDYEYLERWVNDERIHALWSASLIPFPLSKEGLDKVLDKMAKEYGGSAYTVTEDNGRPVGFFAYSVNIAENTGFLQFIVLDGERRGKGYGHKMLELALKYAFHITGVSLVQLNVFDVNESAKRCYQRAGFVERSVAKNVFSYKNESWGRCNMAAVREDKF